MTGLVLAVLWLGLTGVFLETGSVVVLVALCIVCGCGGWVFGGWVLERLRGR